MDRDLKFYFLVIGLPALAFAVGGLVLLHREYTRQQEGIRNWQEVRSGYMADASEACSYGSAIAGCTGRTGCRMA